MKLKKKGNDNSDVTLDDMYVDKIFIKSSPTTNLQGVNKQYVDSLIAANNFAVGDIKVSTSPATPSGFLRCNGAELNKTTYSDLYAAIGDNFKAYNLIGNGKPWSLQNDFNNTFTNGLFFWSGSNAFPAVTTGHNIIVTHNRVYAIGRNNGSGRANTIFTCTINANGTISTWSTYAGTLPQVLSDADTVVFNNTVYVLGGYGGYDNSTLNTIYKATIASDGTLGTFAAATETLPIAVYRHRAIILGKNIYVIGGMTTTTAITNVYSAPIDASGNIGSWTLTNLPIGLCDFGCVKIKNRVYLLGGTTSTNTAVSSVYYAEIDPITNLLGSWTLNTPPLPLALRNMAVVCSKNKLYMLGGNYGTTLITSVYVSIINPDGSLGEWMLEGVLSVARHSGGVFITNGYIFLTGGYTASSTIATRCDMSMTTGGSNSYMTYIANSFIDNDNAKFRLPDYTFLENRRLYYYIKF